MNLLELIPQAILCFIAFLAIIIRLGWKHLNKFIPIFSSNNQWLIHCKSLGEIVAFVALSYILNVWFWSDSSETGSDFWIMSNPVGEMEYRVSTAKQAISRKPFALFNETMNSLPDVIEEIQKMIDLTMKVDISKLKPLEKWLEKKECGDAVAEKLYFMYFKGRVSQIVESLNKFKTIKFWKNKMKSEPAEFDNESNSFKGYSESRIKFLENIMHHFKESESDFRKGMLETTEIENNKIKKMYLISSAVIFMFSVFSIYTKFFNPQFQFSRVGRVIFTILFYALTIQVIIILIYELNTDSLSVCHLKSENFRPYNFKSEYKDGTSTENVFANCITTRTSILSPPNDKIFLPETKYVEIVRERFLNETIDLINVAEDVRSGFETHKERFDEYIQLLSEVRPTCIQVNIHIYTLKQFNADYNMVFLEHKLKFENNVTMVERIFNDKFKNFSEVIRGPIQRANQLINATNFDCYTMFNAYQHGYNRSCFIINSEIISILKMLITTSSVVCAVLHLLNLRKIEFNTEQPQNPYQRLSSNV